MKGKLYVHKNKINGKCYVGQTIERPVSKRWGKKGIGYKGQVKFWNAIEKYGWENFKHIIVSKEFEVGKELNDAEKLLIEKLNSVENGYNTSPGGSNYVPDRIGANYVAVKVTNTSNNTVEEFNTITAFVRKYGKSCPRRLQSYIEYLRLGPGYRRKSKLGKTLRHMESWKFEFPKEED